MVDKTRVVAVAQVSDDGRRPTEKDVLDAIKDKRAVNPKIPSANCSTCAHGVWDRQSKRRNPRFLCDYFDNRNFPRLPAYFQHISSVDLDALFKYVGENGCNTYERADEVRKLHILDRTKF